MFQLKTRSEWEFAYWTLQHAREFDEVFIKSLKQNSIYKPQARL